MSKSIQSLLVGIAIRDRVLGGLRQPITDRVPELRPRGFDQVTLEHLLQMTSGSSYLESDNPLGEHPALYYGTHMTPALLDQSLEEPPGTRWEYKSGDSQLLGLALSRALAPETITDFARRVLWEPLGMEHDGSWAVDHPGGLEKTFCCLAMTAIDLAKIGAMVAAGGAWRGRQLVPRDWIRTSTTPTTAAGGADFYRLGWWVPKELDGGFMGSGHLGQFLFIFPESKVVIVRLGTAASPTTLLQYIMVARQIERALRRSARGRIH